MANLDNPRGFRPLMQDGEAPRLTRYYHSAATAIFIGDPVVKTGTAHTDKDSTLIVAAAGATGVVTGVSASYAAASAGTYVLVYDDPLQEFVGQADTTTTPAVTDMGANLTFTATAGSTTDGTSNYELDFSTATTTATLSAKVRSLDKRIDNVMGAHADFVVTMNAHTEADNTAGI